MRLYSEQGKLVKTLIESGDLDTDIVVLQKLITKRLRSKLDYKWAQNVENGSKVKIKENIHLRYMPQYMRGAILEVNTEEKEWYNGQKYTSVTYTIIEMKYKPRGGFGHEARYAIGTQFSWGLSETDIEIYHEEEELAKIQKEIDKIRDKHERTDK